MAYTDIDDSSAYFTTTLWTGDGTSSGRSITNDANAGDFKPDWLWIKPRAGTNATHHQLYDSSRGVSKSLRSSATAAEIENSAYGYVSAYDTNGFTSIAGSNNNENINENSSTFVAWQWKANGGTTASNTDGTITSTVQANTTAGFSIATYTGNGTEGATFGHGLGVAPKLVIVKGRSNADNWAVFNGTSTTASRSLHLEGTDAEIPVSSYNFWNLYWDETYPSSSVVTLGVDAKVNGNTNTYVSYCFAEKQGYSKIGKYIGNGSADGTFVYTGFKPAWVMCKSTASTSDWYIYDNKREGYNVDNDHLLANSTAVEATADEIDMLSNGFKLRIATDPNVAEAYIYMAFAEHPFVSSKGVPTTAR